MKKRKPVIGITCNFDYRDAVGMVSGMGITGQDWDFVSGDYVYILEKAGGIPVLIPQYKDLEAARPFLDQLDGVLISGGHDVGPERYGAFPKGYCGTIMPVRDEQDLAISKYFLEKKKPILGICRGIQIMNVACGGTLYQDLEKEGGFEHHFGDKYPRNIPWHRVNLEKDSVLESIYGTEEIRVNSFHHQAIKDPGKKVKITAWSEDHVPEAMEVEGHPFALAVQWHPEMMYDSAEQLKLLRAFVEAAGKETES